MLLHVQSFACQTADQFPRKPQAVCLYLVAWFLVTLWLGQLGRLAMAPHTSVEMWEMDGCMRVRACAVHMYERRYCSFNSYYVRSISLPYMYVSYLLTVDEVYLGSL
jgi:hypothetical protein